MSAIAWQWRNLPWQILKTALAGEAGRTQIVPMASWSDRANLVGKRSEKLEENYRCRLIGRGCDEVRIK